MSEPLIICCKEWVVTVALASLLKSSAVQAIYSRKQLVSVLQEYPEAPVILGLSPHEYVVDLYLLRPLLIGREGLFVARYFYWTDYKLSKWLGLERYSFCTWDMLHVPFLRMEELQCFRSLTTTNDSHDIAEIGPNFLSPMPSSMTEVQILERANQWLSWKLAEAGLNVNEVRVLSLMTEGRRGEFACRARSLHKINGLYKLGMTKHVMSLYRGVKVRQELQVRMQPFAVEGITESIRPFRQEVG